MSRVRDDARPADDGPGILWARKLTGRQLAEKPRYTDWQKWLGNLDSNQD
jgi:hypothetical protein